MLTTVLVLQAFLLLFIIILSIVGWRKLTEDQQKLTEKLTEDQQKLTEQLIVGWRKLAEEQQKLTEKLNEKRISVHYEHVIHHEDGFFRNKVVASYRVQLLYDGVPIGDPTEKIVYFAKRVDTEAVQKALTTALQTLQEAIKVSGTPLRVLNTVDDVIKTLSK